MIYNQNHCLIFWLISVILAPILCLCDVFPQASGASKVVQLEDTCLRLDLNVEKNFLTIFDKRTQRQWKAKAEVKPSHGEYDEWGNFKNLIKGNPRIIDTQKTGQNSIVILLEEIKTTKQYFCKISLESEGIVSFEITASDLSTPFNCMCYPPMLECELEQGYLCFCDRSCGVLMNQADGQGYVDKILSCYGNTQCLDMPWIGIVDLNRGDGVMVLIETPADASVQIKKSPVGTYWPEVVWRSSMNSFGYSRKISYRFIAEGGYVALAKHYRKYLKEKERMITLAQKCKAKPAVSLLGGAPPIWGENDIWEFMQEMRSYGVLKAVLCNVTHGLKDANSLAKLRDMGYIVLDYDNFMDILEGPVGFESDNIQETAYRVSPGAGPLKGWCTLNGLQYYSRSSAMALRAARTYIPKLMKEYCFNGRFIDVSGAVSLLEDYHPQHTFDRRTDMKYRRQLYQYFNELGLVIGTEHGNDWNADLVDYYEGSVSGPFWWESASPTGWNAGHLKPLQSRDDLSILYLKYGIGYDTRIPLWQLVYHDCTVTTWYWGDSAGWFYETAPEITDRKDLINILYGTVPLFWRDDFRGYNLSKHKERFLDSYYHTCKFHEVVFGKELLSHEFVTQDRTIQRCRFSNGAQSIVNFGDKVWDYEYENKKIHIAPNGFLVNGPGIYQAKVLKEDGFVTIIKTKDFLLIDSDHNYNSPLGKINGKVLLFKLNDQQWNLWTKNRESLQLNVSLIKKMTGWQTFNVAEIDRISWTPKVAFKIEDVKLIDLRPGLYALMPKYYSEKSTVSILK